MIERKYTLLFIVLVCINLMPVWFTTYLPLQDYPNHLARIHIIKNFENPDTIYNKYFGLDIFLNPYSLSDIVIFALAYILPVETCGRIFLSLYVILFPLSIFYFLYKVKKENLLLGFFSFICIYNFFFEMGFLNFLISLPIFFVALGYWWSKRERMLTSEKIIFIALTILLFLAHFISAMTLFLTIIFLRVYETKSWVKTLGAICVTAPMMALIMLFLVFNGTTSKPFWGCYSFMSIGEILWQTIHTISFKFTELGAYFFPLHNMFFASIILGLMVFPLFYVIINEKDQKKVFKRESRGNGFAHLTLMWIFAFLFFPTALIGDSFVGFIDMRPIPFFIIFSLACVKLDERVKKKIPLLFFLVSVLLVANIWSEYKVESETIAQFVSGIGSIKENSLVLPLPTPLRLGTQAPNPYLHVWGYYVIEKNAITPYLFAEKYEWIKYRAQLPGEEWMTMSLNETFTCKKKFENWDEYYKWRDLDKAEFYDYVIVWGEDRFWEDRQNGKFSLIYTNESLRIYERGGLVTKGN